MRNPLALIVDYAELLTQPVSEERVRRLAMRIIGTTEQLDMLVADTMRLVKLVRMELLAHPPDTTNDAQLPEDASTESHESNDETPPHLTAE